MSDPTKVTIEKARLARLRVLDMIHKGQTSHIASNFSVIDIATVLYSKLQPYDEVVWSKGWAAASIYYFLAQQGKIPLSDLDKFAQEVDGKIQYLGLAETSIPGVWVNGGSVGQGLPVAVGMALAKKRGGDGGKIYCILSDGELNEGTVWESFLIAAHHRLDNLVVIVDRNGWQAMGKTEEVCNIHDLQAALRALGWAAIEVDGHDHEELDYWIGLDMQQPYCIIADTIKGKGVSFMEDHLIYHYKHVTDEDYERAKAELEMNQENLLTIEVSPKAVQTIKNNEEEFKRKTNVSKIVYG